MLMKDSVVFSRLMEDYGNLDQDADNSAVKSKKAAIVAHGTTRPIKKGPGRADADRRAHDGGRKV